MVPKPMVRPSERLAWPTIVDQAATIVLGYNTPVTLRQLFYRLVAVGLIPNTQSAYTTLSRRTTEAREWGRFPELIDDMRAIHEKPTWDGLPDALGAIAEQYRRDRTEGQEWSLYLAVE